MLEGLSNSMSADELLAFLGVDQNTEGAELLLAIANASASSAQDRLTALLLGAAILKGSPTLEEAIQGLRELLEKIQAGIPADEAVDSLTDGAFDSLWQFRNQIAAGALPGLADFLDSLFADNGACWTPPSCWPLPATERFPQIIPLPDCWTFFGPTPGKPPGTQGPLFPNPAGLLLRRGGLGTCRRQDGTSPAFLPAVRRLPGRRTLPLG